MHQRLDGSGTVVGSGIKAGWRRQRCSLLSSRQDGLDALSRRLDCLCSFSLGVGNIDRLSLGSYRLGISEKPLKSLGLRLLVCVVGVIVITNLQNAFKD